jgi:hypothetical protein
MAYVYSHKIYLNVGGTELPIEIKYTVEPGFAGDRVDPPYGPSVEFQSIEAVIETWRFGKKLTDRKAVTGWLASAIENDPNINADLLSEAGEEDACRADDRADMLRDERRMTRAA